MALAATVSTTTGANGPELLVAVVNDGHEPVTLCTVTFAPGLAFEVTDDAGRAVPLGPPPTPPADLAPYLATIAPGGSLERAFAVDELFAGVAPAGRYRVRFATEVPAVDGAWSGPITSSWVDVQVA